MLNYVWKLIPLGVEDYFPSSANANRGSLNNDASQTSNHTTPVTRDTGVSQTIEDQMNAAKVRCESLGFQVGTQSFGECILRLSN